MHRRRISAIAHTSHHAPVPISVCSRPSIPAARISALLASLRINTRFVAFGAVIYKGNVWYKEAYAVTGTAVAAPSPPTSPRIHGMEPRLLTTRNTRHPSPRKRSNAARWAESARRRDRRPCGARAHYPARRSKNVGGAALRWPGSNPAVSECTAPCKDRSRVIWTRVRALDHRLSKESIFVRARTKSVSHLMILTMRSHSHLMLLQMRSCIFSRDRSGA